jgi:hypothetical protein
MPLKRSGLGLNINYNVELSAMINLAVSFPPPTYHGFCLSFAGGVTSSGTFSTRTGHESIIEKGGWKDGLAEDPGQVQGMGLWKQSGRCLDVVPANPICAVCCEKDGKRLFPRYTS